jgi:hypothetical protein
MPDFERAKATLASWPAGAYHMIFWLHVVRVAKYLLSRGEGKRREKLRAQNVFA